MDYNGRDVYRALAPHKTIVMELAGASEQH
jgi:hypothetical protein